MDGFLYSTRASRVWTLVLTWERSVDGRRSRVGCLDDIVGVNGLGSLGRAGGEQTVGNEYGGPGSRQAGRERAGGSNADNKLAEDSHSGGMETSVVVVRGGTGEWFGACSTATGEL